MTEIKGSGHIGKQLWLRTPDKRWIEVPYGAGQDKKVRSLNIHDGTDWQTPTWGQTVRNIQGPGATIDALDVHAPGVLWPGRYDEDQPQNSHYFNPNYQHSIGDDLYTPAHRHWLRLFHTRPRVDPSWRIVPLWYPLPVQVPNRTTDLAEQNQTFAPWINRHSELYADNTVVASDSDFFTGIYVDYVDPPIGTRIIKKFNPKYATAAEPDSLYQQAGLLDLANIRRRLETDFNEQGVDYTGQYHPMTQMRLRRIFVHLKLVPVIWYYGHHGEINEHDYDAMRFQILARSNVNTTPLTYTDLNDVTYQLNIPDSATPQGAVVLDVAASDLNTTLIGTDPPGFNRPTDWYQIAANGPVSTIVRTLQFEAPGENNLVLYPQIVNPVGWADKYHELFAALYLRIDRISLQYSDPDTDVPAEMRTWNSLG